MSTASTRHPRHELKIAWTRIQNENVDFAVVGTSLVGGVDVVQGQLDVVTEPDTFQYFDETARVLGLNYDRVVEEPLGGLSYALGDVSLENTENRFTWGVNSTIGTALKPLRPLKMFMGFRVSGQEKTVPVLYGLTDDVNVSRSNQLVTIPVSDYVSYVNDYELESTMFVDQRTDQIISSILTTVGFTAAQSTLDTGLNTIGFAWFKKGTRAGDAIRQIVESEEGHFYQDKQGLLRFENRRNYLARTTVVWTINKEDTITYERDKTVPVINRVTVNAQPRTVQEKTEIWKSGVIIPIQTAETLEVWATFEEPVRVITSPVATGDYLVNTEEDGSGANMTAAVAVSIDKFVKSAKLTFTNNSGIPGFIIFARLRGTPATVSSQIQEIYEDSASMETYGRKQLTIRNDFIDSESFAYYFARAIVRKYANPMRRLRVTILGMPSIQLKDRVNVQDPDTDAYTEYRVMRIMGKMTPTTFTTTLILREITGVESDKAAVVGTSVVDGTDVVWT